MGKELVITDDFIDKYSSDKNIKKFVRQFFKEMTYPTASKLVKLILKNRREINIKELTNAKRFYQYNMAIFSSDNSNIDEDKIKEVRIALLTYLGEYTKEIDTADENLRKQDASVNLVITKNSTYEKIKKAICENDELNFVYDFNKPDLEVDKPKNNISVQRCYVQITGKAGMFTYDTEYSYNCLACGKVTMKKAYHVSSTKNYIKCLNLVSVMDSSGNEKQKVCGERLSPDIEMSYSKDCNAYLMRIVTDDGERTINSFCFDNINPGYYEVVMIRVNNKNQDETYHILAYKDIEPKVFNVPEKNAGENHLFAIQREIDNFIEKNAGVNIYGLIPPKIAMLVQTIAERLNISLTMHIAMVGEPSTGKSLLSKYWGYMMNSNFNFITSGLNVSIPGLRGTRHTFNVGNNEVSVITTGFLGMYKLIGIDEAGENNELVQNLKTFLYEANYDYSKAGSLGITRKRTAHIIINENINNEYLQQYRASIKKAYRDINYTIGDSEKDDWDETCDLHMPIYKYDFNPYLLKVVKDKRTNLMHAQKWWIDGRDYALHERFPFYFYLVNREKNPELDKVIKINEEHDTVDDNLELVNALRTNDLETWFKTLKPFVKSKNDFQGFVMVDKILEEYNIHADARTKKFYYALIKISRIANKRNEMNEEDYDLLKFFLEKTNCKVDVKDMTNYGIEGAPNISTLKAQETLIENSSSDGFGLPEDEFK